MKAYTILIAVFLLSAGGLIAQTKKISPAEAKALDQQAAEQAEQQARTGDVTYKSVFPSARSQGQVKAAAGTIPPAELPGTPDVKDLKQADIDLIRSVQKDPATVTRATHDPNSIHIPPETGKDPKLEALAKPANVSSSARTVEPDETQPAGEAPGHILNYRHIKGGNEQAQPIESKPE